MPHRRVPHPVTMADLMAVRWAPWEMSKNSRRHFSHGGGVGSLICHRSQYRVTAPGGGLPKPVPRRDSCRRRDDRRRDRSDPARSVKRRSRRTHPAPGTVPRTCRLERRCRPRMHAGGCASHASGLCTASSSGSRATTRIANPGRGSGTGTKDARSSPSPPTVRVRPARPRSHSTAFACPSSASRIPRKAIHAGRRTVAPSFESGH